MDSLDELWRHIRLWLVFGFRLWLVSLGFRRRLVSFNLCVWLDLIFRRRCISFGHGLRLTFDFIIPNLLLRLLPVLNCRTVVASSLPVEFVGPLSDLWRQVGRCFGFGLGLVSLSFGLGCIGLGFRLRLNFGFGLGLVSLSFGLRCIGLGFRLQLSFGFGLRCTGLSIRLSINFSLRLGHVGLDMIQDQ